VIAVSSPRGDRWDSLAAMCANKSGVAHRAAGAMSVGFGHSCFLFIGILM